MKSFQISQSARTTSSASSQGQSPSNKPPNSEDRAVGGSNVKQRQQSPFSRLSSSPQFKTAMEKSGRVAKAISNAKHPKTIESIQKIKKSTRPLTTLEKRRGERVFPPKSQISRVQNNLGFPCELPNDLIENVNIQSKFDQADKKFNLRLRRPLWNTPATRLPKGYDRAPGYNYIRGLMILYPGANLGMNVKAYNNKVYVTSTDQMSIASAACLMGDCIVDVDGIPITSTVSCGERVISGLKHRKFVLMTIERAVDVQAIRVVKFVLLVEKTPEKDPRHLVIREMSMFTPIGADPFNPLLMQAVPPKRMDVMHASKTSQMNITTPLQRSKE